MSTATQARKPIRAMTDEEKVDLLRELRRLKREERAIDAELVEIDRAAEKVRVSKRIAAHGQVSEVVAHADDEITRLLTRAVETGDYSKTPEVATALTIGNPAVEQRWRAVVDRVVDCIPLHDLYTVEQIADRVELKARQREITQRITAIEPRHDETIPMKVAHAFLNRTEGTS